MNAPYSLSLLQRMHRNLPPLVPKDVIDDFKHALTDIESDPHISQRDIEKTMIHFGSLLWPYRKAYEEFYKNAEARHGDEFMRAHLKDGMKQWYELFKKHGGILADLKKGEFSTITHLTSDERTALSQALVETHSMLQKTTRQEILGSTCETYKKRVLEFRIMFEDIEARLSHLKLLAQKEKRHPALAHELDALIHTFELALCGVNPERCLNDLEYCADNFHGRKEDRLLYQNAPAGPFFTELPLPSHVNLFE